MRFDSPPDMNPNEKGCLTPSEIVDKETSGAKRNLQGRGAFFFVLGTIGLLGGWFLFAVDLRPRPSMAAYVQPVVYDALEDQAEADTAEVADGPPSTGTPQIVMAAGTDADEEARSHERAIRFEEVFARGRAAAGKGRHVEAMELLREAVALEPDHADARYKLALSCIRARAYEEARAEHAKLAEIDPNLANLISSLLHSRTGMRHPGTGSRAHAASR